MGIQEINKIFVNCWAKRIDFRIFRFDCNDIKLKVISKTFCFHHHSVEIKQTEWQMAERICFSYRGECRTNLFVKLESKLLNKRNFQENL